MAEMAVRSRYVPMITEHEPRIGGSPDIDKKIRNMNPRRLSDEDRLERLMVLRQEKAGKASLSDSGLDRRECTEALRAIF
jgi:hypothetical protein